MTGDVCSIQDCEQPRKARGWCKRHYYRWQRQGDPEVTLTDCRPVAIRIWDYVSGGDFTECWIWTRSLTAKGYGQVSDNGRMRKVHRIAYECMVGPIPDGLELDHLCFNRACCNPWHLDPVTPAVNKERSSNALRTHCKRDHEFTPENTYVTTAGGRQCRACEHSRKLEKSAA